MITVERCGNWLEIPHRLLQALVYCYVLRRVISGRRDEIIRTLDR